MPLFRFLFVALVGYYASQLYGQVDRAYLSGTVTDPTNAVVSGAKVKIESPDTGFQREILSNAEGFFVLNGLPVGDFTVTVSKDGFQTLKFTQVNLLVGQSRTLNAQLRLSATASQVEVTAEANPLQETSPEVGLAVNENQIKNLPNNGRNWTSFLALAPGATNTGDGTQNSVRFFGRSRDDNNFTFDGVDATGVKDPRQEANLRLNISLEAIEEFRVSSSQYSAESGNGAGAQLNLVSKSGTNQFHGSAFEFFRNDKLDARRPIDAAKPPFRLNQFGGSFGGRIIKDRTFFFSTYEGLQQRLASTFISSVPSAAFRARVTNPTLQPILQAYRPGTSRTANADIDQLTVVASQPTQEHSGLIKVDHRFNDRNSMFVRYNLDDGVLTEIRNALLETRVSNFRTQNGVVQFQRIWTPSLISETRLGVNRSALRRDTNGTFNEGINIAGFAGLIVNQREVEIGTSYSWVQNLTWTKGRHTVKGGVELRKIDLVLSNSGGVTTAFSSRDNFIANRADSVQIAGALGSVKGLRPYHFYFLQDEIKLTRNLTLNLGGRYEYYFVAKTSNGLGRVLDLERCNGFCPAGTPWYFPDRNNFAPRTGLAWAPGFLKNRTVFRLGYGIFYGPGQIDDVNAPIDSIPETFALSRNDQPALAFPAIQFLGQARSTGVSARAVQRDRQEGYSQQWTVSVQQQLPFAFVLQTAYVGSNGHHLFGRSFINTINPATGRRPYTGFSNIDIKTNNNNSSFQGLQVSLLRAMRHGLQAQLQYGWSHNINDNAGAGDGNNNMISDCRRCDRGDAPWDIRHTATANVVYQLPIGRGTSTFNQGVLGRVFEGWNVSGLWTVRTGLPFDVTINRAATDLPDGVISTPGRAAPAQRPDFVPGVSFYTASRSPLGYLNPAAFRAPARGTWGNLPRNALRGPGLWQIDFAAAKRTTLRENLGLEFRSEFFNLFNRAQYGFPVSNFSNPGTFGQILSVVNASPVGAGGPRQIQLSLRLNF